jgi:hypothetical protein
MNKVSEEQAKEMEQAGELSRQLFSGHPALKFKVDANMAISVIYSLIMNIKNKNVLPQNHLEVFDFMADHLIDNLYE